jgi:hypothetical protein
MELFRNYQREFESTVQGIQKKFTQCGSLSGGSFPTQTRYLLI